MSHPDRVTAKLIEHIVTHRYETLTPSAVAATSTFVLDSLGVALAGSRVPLVSQLTVASGELASEFRPSPPPSSTAIKSITKNGTACMNRLSCIPWQWCSQPCSRGRNNTDESTANVLSVAATSP